jgi:hypothetical protein
MKQDYDFSSCARNSEKNRAFSLEGSWANVAMVSLVPIPIGWLAVYILIRIYRWVKAGFKKPDDR